ncbi:MAG: response regulator [Burkholderiaceae bacterium]|jgi:two-component system KDP operon response regulator KdpE
MNDSSNILIVEDNPAMQRVLTLALVTEGFRILVASTAGEARVLAKQDPPDLYLIDLGLPDSHGVDLIRGLRAWTRKPILVVTATLDEAEKVRILDAGADDYITKPFMVDELKARVRVALRRLTGMTNTGARRVFRLGDVLVDFSERRVWRQGELLRLTPIEFRLLHVLCENTGKIISHAELLQSVWGSSRRSETQYLHIYVNRLREKLEGTLGGKDSNIQTYPRMGYQLIASEIIEESDSTSTAFDVESR